MSLSEQLVLSPSVTVLCLQLQVMSLLSAVGNTHKRIPAIQLDAHKTQIRDYNIKQIRRHRANQAPVS